MLAALFLCSIAIMLAATALLFAPFGAHRGPVSRPLAFVVTVLVACGGGVAVGASGAPVASALAVAMVLGVAGTAWLPLTSHWNARGHVAWTAMTVSGAAYLAYMTQWTFRSDLGAVGTLGGVFLLLFEAAAFALGCMYGWELADVLARRDWPRRNTTGFIGEPDRFPFVSLHVPAYNEPPDMVIATLESLLAIDYPSYEIVMLDDNTKDEELWRPVEAYCATHGITFHHLADWPGYKSGALNFGLTVTDPRAEVIGVVDADYLVDPDYLRRCAPLFGDPRLGFVQTPQDYREWQHAPYYRRLYYSYDYFFSVSQASRNERGGAIFGGTMGLIRRDALEAVGGWDEWCITEDAELSLRLLRAGYTGQHVEASYGQGVMPLTFEALKRQRFRWCFGGVQILRKHWRSLMPWDRSPANQLTWRQRYDYLAGGLQWFGDLLAAAFAVLLFVGALNLTLGSGFVFRRLAGALLIVPPLLLGLGIIRSIALVRRRTGASRRDAAGALTMWLALSLTVSKACAQGLLHRDGVFLRTPKTRGDATWRDAVRGNKVECGLGLVLLAVVPLVLMRAAPVTALALGGLLIWHGGAFLLAPAQSLAAIRADLSPELRALRRSEWVRDRLAPTIKPVSISVAAIALVGGTAMGLVMLAPQPPSAGPTADLFADARGKDPGPGPSSRSSGGQSGPTTSVITASSLPTVAPTSTSKSNSPSTVAALSGSNATTSTVRTGTAAASANGVAPPTSSATGGPTTVAGAPTTNRPATTAPTTAPAPTTTPTTSRPTPSTTAPTPGPPSPPTSHPHP